MASDSGHTGLAANVSELVAQARVAILALAPDESPDTPAAPISAEAAAYARTAVAALAARVESGGDPLRALLAADMVSSVDEAASLSARGRAKLVAVLILALSIISGDPSGGTATDALPSRSPLALANELRALRGVALLSGNIVFAVAVDAGSPPGGESEIIDPRLAASARRLRSYYQQGLIVWLAGGSNAKAGAGRIAEVFARLHALSHGSIQESLWRAAASFANLLRDDGWRSSTAIKRLLGQLDGQLKALGEGQGQGEGEGEGGVAIPDAAPALVQDLLFYLGEGRDVDATIGVFPSRAALLAAFTAPPRAHPDQPTAVLSVLNELLAISGQLMEALAPDESWTRKRSWLTERLLHVADGLGLLGAHVLRHRALEEVGLLRKTPGSGDPPAGGWGRMAERLHALGAELLSAAGMDPGAAVAEDTAGMPSSGRIARRLEADLLHAEALIRRLEQEPANGPAEAPAAPVQASDDDHDAIGGAAGLRHRIDAFTGAVRAGNRNDKPGRGVAASPSASLEAFAPVPVDHELLDDLGRVAAEIDASRARLELQVGALREGLQDMDNSIRSLAEELGGLRIQADALRAPHDPEDSGQLPPPIGGAPPAAGIRERLERLASDLSGLSQLRDGIATIAADSRSVLVQQAREHVALEQRLMQSRLQPLDVQLEHLRGEVARRATDAGKQVQLRVDAGGLHIEPEKMAALLPVLQSLTCSMIEAGVEPPRARVLAGRAPGCLMEMRFRRRGADLTMDFSADCRAPAATAVAEAQAFLRPLGGLLNLVVAAKFETLCRLQMPLAPRVSTVLLVTVSGEILALPLAEVEAVLQVSAEALEAAGEDGLEHEDERWRIGHLNKLLGLGEKTPAASAGRLPLVLVVSGGARHALIVDAIGERVDVVVRSVAPQLRALGSLAGAAILGDGQVVLLLDVGSLVKPRSQSAATPLEEVT